MSAPSKAAATLAAVFALGLASCGGEEEPSTGASSEARGQGTTESRAKGQESTERESGAQSGSGGSKQAPANDTSQGFTPRPHSDSGGGSESFRTPGADNSVQDYGSEADSSELDQAATALHTFYDARAAQAWQVACEQLSAGLLASLEGRSSPEAEPQMSCAKGLALTTNPETRKLQREEARIDIGSLRAEGDSGFLLYRDREGVPYAIAVVREDGEWRVAGLAGLALS